MYTRPMVHRAASPARSVAQPVYTVEVPYPVPVPVAVTAPPPVPVQREVVYVQEPPKVQVVQSPPQYQYVHVQSPPEVKYIQGPVQYVQVPGPVQIVQQPVEVPIQVPVQVPVEVPVKVVEKVVEHVEVPKEVRVPFIPPEIEAELAALRKFKAEATRTKVTSQTRVYETYKVKTFEEAAALALADGTDDGLYNGLPIEVAGQGLYKDLVARGVKATKPISSLGKETQTYKVKDMDIAMRLAQRGGSQDGTYNGLPIEVEGKGLLSNLLKEVQRSW